MLFVLGTPSGITKYGPLHGFPHVLYQLWLIDFAVRHLEVFIRRRRTQVTWWWPCDMNQRMEFLWCVCIYIYMFKFNCYLTLSTCVWRWLCTRYTRV